MKSPFLVQFYQNMRYVFEHNDEKILDYEKCIDKIEGQM